MRNEVIFWNNVYRDLVRRTGGGPGLIARAGAMMHAAMFNAINATVPAATRKTAFDRFAAVAAAGVSKEAALAHAANGVLKHLYPDFSGFIDGKLGEATLYFSGNAADKAAGQAIGEQAGTAMINDRGNNAAGAGYMDAINVAYSEQATVPGQWRQTGSGNALGPNWPSPKPFAMLTSSGFRPPSPATSASRRRWPIY